MFSLPSLFNAPARIERQKKDLVAKLLKTSPEALAAFEKQYAEKCYLSQEKTGLR